MAVEQLFLRFGIAVFIGFLVGLQREYAFDDPRKELSTGVRTFALLGLIGCAGAMLCEQIGSAWPLVAIIAVVGAFLAINYYVDITEGDGGLTTETSAILTLLCGAIAYSGQLSLAVAIAVLMTALLAMKLELQNLVKQITREDVLATLKFAIISAIILPVLPNRELGPEPFNIFNPFKIWLLVVLISGISFVGYILIKIIGARRGIGLTGFLGGLASSTAVTLSFTARSKDSSKLSGLFASAIMIAWTVMFARVLITIAAINIALLRYIWIPITAAMVAGYIVCFFLMRRSKTDSDQGEVSFVNPFELKPAIKFGLIFLIVLAIARAAQLYLGDTGIYLSSFVAGLADVDAIALTLAQMAQGEGAISGSIAGQGIVLAAIANTLAKGVIVIAGGSQGLRRAILPGFIIMMVTGLAFAFLQPV